MHFAVNRMHLFNSHIISATPHPPSLPFSVRSFLPLTGLSLTSSTSSIDDVRWDRHNRKGQVNTQSFIERRVATPGARVRSSARTHVWHLLLHIVRLCHFHIPPSTRQWFTAYCVQWLFSLSHSLCRRSFYLLPPPPPLHRPCIHTPSPTPPERISNVFWSDEVIKKYNFSERFFFACSKSKGANVHFDDHFVFHLRCISSFVFCFFCRARAGKFLMQK